MQNQLLRSLPSLTFQLSNTLNRNFKMKLQVKTVFLRWLTNAIVSQGDILSAACFPDEMSTDLEILP